MITKNNKENLHGTLSKPTKIAADECFGRGKKK
jgi:hypothetical protein